VDKDLASSILARDVEAEVLLIATDVDGIYEGFGTLEQRLLDRLTPEDALRGIEDGKFPAGSMGPKVEAAASFVAAGGERALICALDDAPDALQRHAGTEIVPNRLS
jgi:carbamate kinase